MKALKKLANDIFVLDDFLSEQEYLGFIEQAESTGFSVADVDTGEGKEVIAYIRNNERVDMESIIIMVQGYTQPWVIKPQMSTKKLLLMCAIKQT